MITNFKYRYDDGAYGGMNIARVGSASELTSEERHRLEVMQNQWDFYEGYHWEDIEETDAPQITTNYTRLFVDKYVAFEFGKGFVITVPENMEDVPVTINDTITLRDSDTDRDGVVEGEEQGKTVTREKTIVEFLDEVWKNNKRAILTTEIGQMKSITGDAWVRPSFVSAEELKEENSDPFDEFPNGMIRLTLLPTQYAFPRFNPHDRDRIDEFLVIYPIHKDSPLDELGMRGDSSKNVLYKEIWTKDRIVVKEDSEIIDEMENPYGFIPFVQIKNYPLAGRSFGQSDLDDVIPLNTEYNLKNSDMSEVIDYHSAPITLVYGAKIGNLEKGANKVWGGLPKDSRVENLYMQGDLVAAQSYNSKIKTSMCEVGSVPETVIGGAQAISNTSGVALQYMNLPLVERTNIKKDCTVEGIEYLHKMILAIAVEEGLIKIPDGVQRKDFFTTYVKINDTLPKDTLLELQQIQMEMLYGLECRHGALKRLGRDDASGVLAEVDREREEHPELFNQALQTLWYQNNQANQSPQINSGFLNGQTPNEELQKELTGQTGETFE